jgi:hypothetical protein
MAPTLFALTFAGVAHAQGTISFSGAQTFMQTVQTFAIYAGAVICFGGLIFAGIRMMSGRFQDAIPGLFGALFGAGVLGWGAGWIGSLSPTRSNAEGAASSREFCAAKIMGRPLAPRDRGSAPLRRVRQPFDIAKWIITGRALRSGSRTDWTGESDSVP